jgi:hypothetical protein
MVHQKEKQNKMAEDFNLRLAYIEYGMPINQYKLDFNEVANSIPMGVERLDISGDTRKTVQQTRGIENGDSYTDNMYVDTWYISPNVIVLSGVVKIPEAMEIKVSKKMQMNRTPFVGETFKGGWEDYESFIKTIENFYRWNSLPARVRNGDELRFYDFIRGGEYRVTMKSRKFGTGVDRPFLIPFDIQLIVLESTEPPKNNTSSPSPGSTITSPNATPKN